MKYVRVGLILFTGVKFSGSSYQRSLVDAYSTRKYILHDGSCFNAHTKPTSARYASMGDHADVFGCIVDPACVTSRGILTPHGRTVPSCTLEDMIPESIRLY